MPVSIKSVFAGTVDPPFDGDFGRFERNEPVFVHDRQRYFGDVEGRAALGTVEDDVFHFVGAQIFRAVFGQNPFYRIYDVAFAAAVRSEQCGNAVRKIDMSSVGK